MLKQPSAHPVRSFIFMLVLLLGLGAVVLLAQRSQDLRQKASGGPVSLSILSSSASAAVGTSYTQQVRINTGGTSVTAVELHLKYNPEFVEYKSSSVGSVFPTTLSPVVVENGTIKAVVGVAPQMPAIGNSVTVVNITFTAKKKGVAFLESVGTRISAIGHSGDVSGTVSNGTVAIIDSPFVDGKISMVTPTVSLQADSISIKSGSKTYSLQNVTSFQLISDPGNPAYTTLEAVWTEPAGDMSMNMYFRADGQKWWMYDLRTSNGEPHAQSDWIFYTEDQNTTHFNLPLGTAFTGDFRLESPTNNNEVAGTIEFKNMRLIAFPNATPGTAQPSSLPSGSPSSSPVSYNASFEQGSLKRWFPTAPNTVQQIDVVVTSNTLSAEQLSQSASSLHADWIVDPTYVEVIEKRQQYAATCPYIYTNQPCIHFLAHVRTLKTGATGVRTEIKNSANDIIVWNADTIVISDTSSSNFLMSFPFLVKLAGVTRDVGPISAIVSVSSPLNTSISITKTITLTHTQSGVYSGTFTEVPSDPATFNFADPFRISIKAEKHVGRLFAPVSANINRTALDLTAKLLQPGDLATQDGVVNAGDIAKIISVIGKPSQTEDDLRVADVNYDNIVNAADIGLVFATLSTRSDEGL